MEDQSKKEETAIETTKAAVEKPEMMFAIIPNNQTQTMILCPVDEGQTSIKLTVQTAKILIAMLDHQLGVFKSGGKEETTAATVVSKDSLKGKQNSTVAIELYQLIEDKDFTSIQEISKTMYAIAINRNR